MFILCLKLIKIIQKYNHQTYLNLTKITIQATENQDNNEVAMKSRRSRTVPTTPMHCTNKPKNAQITPAINEPPETNNTHSNFRNNISKMMCASHTTAPNNSSSLNKSLYWEGPPAHFMLPTHAIHCRLSRSVERCPRACKGNIR